MELLRGADFEDPEDAFEVDEKMMTDLHLGNALNLDQVEYLLKGQFRDYSIFIPDHQRHQWTSIQYYQMRYTDEVIGLLSPTQHLLLQPSPPAVIRQTLYKTLVSIIGRGLKERGINIPLSNHYEEFVRQTVTCRSTYIEYFRFLLKLICMISECSRGGRQSRYPGIIIDQGVVWGSFCYIDLKWTVYGNNSFCRLDDHTSRISYYGTFDSLLLLMDTLGQRLCLEIGMQIASCGKMHGVVPYKYMEDILYVGDCVLLKYGNHGFEFIALFEALVVSILLKNNPDPITDNQELYNNCRIELQSMVTEKTFDTEILNVYDTLGMFLSNLSNEALSNVFCIYRIWGHPRVNIKEGMRKVMTKGIVDKHSSAEMARLVLCQFRKMFLIEFFDKHHAYPKCLFTSNETTYIQDCISSCVPIFLDSVKYCVWDFEWVEIEKLWELPETYDVCHILNDKAVSPTRSELFNSLKAGKGAVIGVQRRGIIRWLLSDSIRCKEFLSHVDEHGLDIDSLIIGMYEKEREIKIKARMFSLMSEQMRMYFVLTEEMISNHILQYFPQITMKDPLHVQIKKLWTISGLSHEFCLDPIINIDFEKWNLNMREELTFPLFKQLDRLFGYSNLISRTHEIFFNSYIYSSSGKYLPRIDKGELVIDPPMTYTYHRGGFEGLRQKGWTVATICLLSYIADMLKIKVNLLGQGDNQVVRIYMPHSYWNNLVLDKEQRILRAKEILNKYIKAMEDHFFFAGLPIKLRETWKSTRLYMYGKNMFMDGKSLPQWTKKLLRSYALTNEGTLTISGVIGTIATNMCAAAHASEKPDIMYVLYLLLGEWSLEYLLAYHPFTRETLQKGEEIAFSLPGRIKRHKLKSGRIEIKRLMTTILLIPTAVGGSITIPLLGFIIRGFPDNASEGYTWLKLLKSVESQYKELFENWYSFLCNDTAEYDMLIQSPWTLNHKKPPTPGLQSRDIVRTWLLSGAFKGNHFLGYVKIAMSGFDRKRICDLMIGPEINPLILNEIYNSFPQSYLDQVLRRVENTRTVRKMALKLSSREPVIIKLMKIETEFLGYLYWRGFEYGKVYSPCATEHCRIARNSGWGRIIKGLTTPHPLEYMHDATCKSSEVCNDSSDYIYCRIDSLGDFPPYLGSNVRTKVVSLQDIAMRAEPLVATSAKLLRYAQWLNLGPNSINLIKKNISIVCDTNVFSNLGDQDDSFYAGCVEHRFNPASASEGCFINYSPQVGQRVFMSSDCMDYYGRGRQNFTLHFQALYCYIQYIASYITDSTFMHYHIRCTTCISPIDDNICDIQDFEHMLSKIYTEERITSIHNALGFLNKRIVTFEENFNDDQVEIMIADSQDINLPAVVDGVHALLATKSALLILQGKRDAPDMMGSDDLQTFPRVYGYKLSTFKLLNLVTEMLILLKLARMRHKNTAPTIDEAKYKLRIQLLKLPLEKFKGIASLCIGRTWNRIAGESAPSLNYGEFPEDPIGFLGSVRAELISRLEAFISFSHYTSLRQIPHIESKSKEIRMLIAHSLLGGANCRSCLRGLWSWIQTGEEFRDCALNHLRFAKSRLAGIQIPLDTAVKYLEVNPKVEDPIQINEANIPEYTLTKLIKPINGKFLTIETSMSVTENILSIKDECLIRLPTNAIYKWDAMLSNVMPDYHKSIIVLGDGTGYTSLVASRRFAGSIIYPSALLERKRFIPQDLSSIRPFASRIYSNVSGKLLESVVDDILNERWIPEFLTFISGLQGPILLISDLEGAKGNAPLTSRIFAAITCLAGQIDFVCKVYLHEEYQMYENVFVYINPFCNLNYAEGFMSNIYFNVMEGENVSAINVEHFTNVKMNVIIRDFILLKEIQYDEALVISKRIAYNTFHKNMIPLSDGDLDAPSCVILYRTLAYLSGNYKAPYQIISQDDNRLMLDGMLRKIIRGIKMLLLMVFGRNIISTQYFHSLNIVRASRDNRPHRLKTLQMVLVTSDCRVSITKKEITAALIMSNVWKQGYKGNTNPTMPQDIIDLYVNEIYPGQQLTRMLGYVTSKQPMEEQ